MITTLSAFFSGYFPYPFGWIVITLLLIARVTANSGNNDN